MAGSSTSCCAILLRDHRYFDVGAQETFELDGRARGLKDRAIGFDGYSHAFFVGIGHLASDGAFPDHIEQAELIMIQFPA